MHLGPKTKVFYDKHIKKLSIPSPQDTEFNINIFRVSVSQYFQNLLRDIKLPLDITIEKIELFIEQHKVKVTIYKPAKHTQSLPMIIFHPGGGLALDMTKEHAHACAEISYHADAAVICIQPPLSPENKFPEIFNVAYKATQHFYEHADQYGCDRKKFILSGYSMGGTLIALITNKATESQDFPITGQVIVSGVLDLTNPPTSAQQDFMFNPGMHLRFIEMCLPDSLKIDDIKTNPNYSPLINRSAYLPSTVLIAGDCDAFKEDSFLMAKHLIKIGADVEIIILPGQIHNALLLFPVMADEPNPAVVAGQQAKLLIERK